MAYRICPRCELVLGEPKDQRDHRCPRCLIADGKGIEMKPLERAPDASLESIFLTSAGRQGKGRGG